MYIIFQDFIQILDADYASSLIINIIPLFLFIYVGNL